MRPPLTFDDDFEIEGPCDGRGHRGIARMSGADHAFERSRADERAASAIDMEKADRRGPEAGGRAGARDVPLSDGGETRRGCNMRFARLMSAQSVLIDDVTGPAVVMHARCFLTRDDSALDPEDRDTRSGIDGALDDVPEEVRLGPPPPARHPPDGRHRRTGEGRVRLIAHGHPGSVHHLGGRHAGIVERPTLTCEASTFPATMAPGRSETTQAGPRRAGPWHARWRTTWAVG